MSRALGNHIDGRPELSVLQHVWLYKHIQCDTGGQTDGLKCPITGTILQLPMDDHQIIIQTTRVLERFEPLRFRMKDSPGNCKVWMALINKVSIRFFALLFRLMSLKIFF